MTGLFYGLVLAASLGIGLFVLPAFLMRRAVSQVIGLFRKHHSLGIDNAKTTDELGLRPLNLLDRMMKGRDYKPYALQALMKADVIRPTEDGRLYLSEENLAKFLKRKRVS